MQLSQKTNKQNNTSPLPHYWVFAQWSSFPSTYETLGFNPSTANLKKQTNKAH